MWICRGCQLDSFYFYNIYLILFMLTIVVWNTHGNIHAQTQKQWDWERESHKFGKMLIVLQIVFRRVFPTKVCSNDIIYWQKNLTMTIVVFLYYFHFIGFFFPGSVAPLNLIYIYCGQHYYLLFIVCIYSEANFLCFANIFFYNTQLIDNRYNYLFNSMHWMYFYTLLSNL